MFFSIFALAISCFTLGSYLTYYFMNRERKNQAVQYFRSHPVHASFIAFIKANPDMRFWQALAYWAERRVFVTRAYSFPREMHITDFDDTYEWDERQGVSAEANVIKVIDLGLPTDNQ